MDTSVGRGRPGVVIIPGIGSDPATQEQRRQEQLEALAELPAILKEFEAMLDATEKPSKEEFAKQCEQFELMWAAGIPAREVRGRRERCTAGWGGERTACLQHSTRAASAHLPQLQPISGYSCVHASCVLASLISSQTMMCWIQSVLSSACVFCLPVCAYPCVLSPGPRCVWWALLAKLAPMSVQGSD
jgi:hypothetical protein